uniref:Ribonuclease H-like n=1 Tax=Nicotiana tabacum TaxID=4097 RepID=A0A1S4C1C5_TOBAC|nr:PREDICTED: ribonuclease H-like [Nicotiana tabacum]
MENQTLKLKVTKALWELPDHGWVKINTDGASMGNPGRSSIGFVLRGEEGDIRYERGKEIQETTNTEAEAAAILEAMRYCVHHGYINILVQTDSMLMKNVIEGTWDPPWAVAAYLEEINELMRRSNTRVTYIMREGNKLADYLANCALDNGDFEA